MLNDLFWIVPVCAIIALLFARIFFKGMMKESEGTDTMKRIAGHVRKGAMAYLRQQYRVVALVFLVLCALFAWMAYGPGLQNPWVWFAFLTGGFFSGLAGYIGMKTATYASARTANAARRSLNDGLKVAFRSGAVMGLVVVGLALLDISLWWLLLDYFVEEATETEKAIVITTTMLTFGMGASTQALFARVGGGIFTKAADVGADLVGKVEAGIPEDDPRNPATIADNVGDNVGDVAGMGADLYESYCGSILATAALGAAAFRMEPDAQFNAILAPMLIAAFGVILSLLGIFLVKTKEGASQQQLLRALDRGINVSSLLIVGASFLVIHLLGLSYWICGSVIVGLVTGIIIGKATEYYTSHAYKPTQDIAKSSETGPATVIIKGIGTGMISTAIPVLTIVAGIILSFLFAAEFSFANMSMGLYGVGIAAVGMLSTLGITLATDAYGPIADNAGGNAEMSQLGEEVRHRTDALDALGNTTAATGKGFAIGSAALTGLALIASYIEEIKIGLLRMGEEVLKIGDNVVRTADATLTDFMNYYDVTLMNPKVLSGIFIGSMMAFVFCGLTMNAVGRAAQKMVNEVRRQFREIKGIMTGEGEPDYAKCVEISTKGAQHEMVFPSLLAIIIPVVMGLIFGVSGVIGLLAGGLGTGFVLAIFMANSGGAWDNAKKYIEEGNLGGKGSDNHKATVIGDTVGDPFKDTSGPSLNILIKLMSMVAIVMAGVTCAFSLL
ncbi:MULTISPECIES: sodium-translocating pyrophosphatase [Butyricimonas]|jgi:K(+)-stimulated pyrophosphate-energized sodium pump|uniref:Putative K(+)-stimulated pyrophosphate-energized sodium pump n=1 Tax=Butyricimonas faecihominis TaxID=1472416 RepID=A0A7W6HTJ6_9BACT|nr:MULTISPECIES: sodium-translocating pyrophosphatase [Butyricimonas]MBS6686781.1 sodium-translocating pyrophosphatase [Sanguibacteroides justesenii]KAB1507637.1 sodium-translocating pyrophosphatase [Butyricimonas faecihominis]MBB4024480.1 K(+)-stimulated pyrophosphate-energized sodium pump [Butyricimonas faecihominis]OUN66199.1 sodium-translocating pyrophosphatase [Butyricimonas sp. An62]WOF08070.1 sodium-translocating pyrophosphatase [Butyricimonas faecihominis]